MVPLPIFLDPLFLRVYCAASCYKITAKFGTFISNIDTQTIILFIFI